MRIIHLETLVVSSFGLLDNDGNVIQTIRTPEPVKVGVLGQDSFIQAFKLVNDYKGKLQQELDKKIAEDKAKEVDSESNPDKKE